MTFSTFPSTTWLSQNCCYTEAVSNTLLLEQRWIHSLCLQETSAPLTWSVLPTGATFLPAGNSCCMSLVNLKPTDTHTFTYSPTLFLLHLHPSPETHLGFYMQNSVPFRRPEDFSLRSHRGFLVMTKLSSWEIMHFSCDLNWAFYSLAQEFTMFQLLWLIRKFLPGIYIST